VPGRDGRNSRFRTSDSTRGVAYSLRLRARNRVVDIIAAGFRCIS
jgi:hypothetical protein